MQKANIFLARQTSSVIFPKEAQLYRISGISTSHLRGFLATESRWAGELYIFHFSQFRETADRKERKKNATSVTFKCLRTKWVFGKRANDQQQNVFQKGSKNSSLVMKIKIVFNTQNFAELLAIVWIISLLFLWYFCSLNQTCITIGKTTLDMFAHLYSLTREFSVSGCVVLRPQKKWLGGIVVDRLVIHHGFGACVHSGEWLAALLDHYNAPQYVNSDSS